MFNGKVTFALLRFLCITALFALWIGAPLPASAAIQGEYFSWTGASPPADPFNPANHRGTRIDANVNFNWPNDPGIGAIGIDMFSVRWRGQVYIPTAGSWTFYTATDDGARLWVNNNQLINQWVDQGVTERSGAIALSVGWHDIEMHYFENGGGAVAQMSYEGPGVGKQIIPAGALRAEYGKGWLAEYYNGNWGGAQTLAVSRNDPTINFDWGTGSPQPGVNVDNFSGRWRAKISVPTTQTYTFYLTSDDGPAMWLFGTERFNQLPVGHAPTEYSFEQHLTAGQKYYVEVRFNEFGGGALCRLEWSHPGLARQVVPQQYVHAIWNEAPSDIALSNNVIGSNLPANTVVGNLSTTDIDNATGANPAQTHTYSLVSGSGDVNNGAFNISGSQLRTNSANMTPGTYFVRVRTTDNGQIPNNLTYEEYFSITVNDTTPPTVSLVEVQTGLTVDVVFSEAMGTGVSTPSNYVISEEGKGTLSNNPDSVALVAGNRYRLTWTTGEMLIGANVVITVNNVRDVAGNLISSPNWARHTGGGIGIRPTVSTVLVTAPNTVRVTFSEPVSTGATTPGNYTLSGLGKGTLGNNPSSVVPVDGAIYELTWSSGIMLIGGDVTVTVGSSVADLAGNTLGTPNSATHTGGGQAVPPNPPVVNGTTPTNNPRPQWTWTPGGGGNGTYRYDLDASGAWTQTAAASFTPASNLSEGTHRLVVQERDAAGNWSADSFFDIFVDLTPPNPPVVNGTTPTNNPRPEWTWTPGGGGIGTYRYDLDNSGVWTQTTATSFIPASDLSEGSHRLVVQEQDDAGNWSVDSFFDIFVDLTKPNPPVVDGMTPTNNPRPTWTWTPGGGGIGTYRYDLDNSGVWTETTATAFTPASDLSEGSHRLVVQERDDVGNWSDGSFFDIFVDLTKPNAPLVNGPALTNNPRPEWTWTPGGGGNGTYRYDLDASGAWTETTAAAFTPASDLSEGSHRLVVQEQDDAGNWSVDSFFDVFVDLTPPNAPVVDGVTPTNNPRPTWTWTTGGGDGNANFRYDLNNSGVWTETTATAYTPASDLSAGTHRLVVQERDPAGNWSVDGFFDIFVDLVAPEPPVVSGDAATSNPRPTWTWTPGGGGNGTYRYDLDASGVWTETITTSFTPGLDLSDGLHTLAVQERDAVGNWSSSGTHGILVDAAAPVALCQDVTVYLSAPLLDAAAIDGGSTDNTGIVDWQIDGGASVLFTCADILSNPNTVTLRVTDAVGNHDECEALVTVMDDIAPVVTIPGGSTRHVLLNAAWTPPAEADAEDNCDGALAAALVDDGGLDTAVLGEYTLVYAATDAAGNIGTAELTVFVEESVYDPIVVNPVGETYFVRDVGESVTFEVSVSGGSGLSPLQFQWMRISGGKAHTQIDGADWSAYTIDNIEEADGGQYLCEVFDDESEPAASPVFTLVVNEASGVPAAGAFGLVLAAAALALAGARRMRRN